MKQSITENLVGRRSANVGKSRSDEHKVIYRSEHRHNGNDESSTRSADEDHAFIALQDLGDVDRTFTRIGTIELLWVHINGHTSDTVIRQVLAHPIPAARTLGTAMHQCDGVGFARHAPNATEAGKRPMENSFTVLRSPQRPNRSPPPMTKSNSSGRKTADIEMSPCAGTELFACGPTSCGLKPTTSTQGRS
jgi:hypothetical protein